MNQMQEYHVETLYVDIFYGDKMPKILFVLSFILTTVFAQTDKEVKEKLEKMKSELGDTYKYSTHEKYFCVATDCGDKDLKRCLGTISNVRSSLLKFFVEKEPDKPLMVYLFKDEDSYNAYCKDVLGHEPTTPYGFFLPSSRKLVMNIGTGTGTLAHELVHPFLETDFPGVPAWFNEGFASLHEQSSFDENGECKGLVNWRLPGLQDALKKSKCPKLEDVMNDDADAFYQKNSGVKYALSRYFCFYLQEKGKLEDFYKEYRDGFKKDKSGKKALEKVMDQELEDVERDLHAWSLKLKYR